MNHEAGETHEEGMRERLKLASDPYRPAYHYLPPSNWMNDPNGTFFWQGRYHLFYQYNPHEAHHGGRTGTIHWGHTVSENLVDWEDLPIALTPTPDGPDMDGCFSGTAFAGPGGVPTIIYHGVPGGICLATSTDDMLVHWEKHPANPVILTPGPDDPYKVDGAPCGWVEGDTCYAITGNSSHDAFDGREPDRAYLFKSDDMAHWEYMHPFYEGGVYTERGEDCAVPDFFPLGDKHVLLFASHRRGPHYYVGSYADNKFIPEHHRRMAFGETNFTARPGILNECQTLLDDNNRRILFTRISEARYGCVQRASGWAGIMALPSVLSLAADNHLLVEPVPELESLRSEHQHIADLAIAPDSIVPLDPVTGNRLEIRAVFEWDDAEEFGLVVCCSPGGEEQTQIRFNANPNHYYRREIPPLRELILDVTRSSTRPDINNRESQRCHAAHVAGEPVELRVFIDRSVVEVFVNGGRYYLAKRIYPARPDSVGVRVFARGGKATLRSLDAWQMKAIWPLDENG